MQITITHKFSYLLIEINEIPHLCFKTIDFVGFQSWVDGSEKWVIEYYFASGCKITTEYNSTEKFEPIVKELKRLFWGF